VSATTAAHAAADLGGIVDLILYGGASDVGLESTIVAIDTEGRVTLLRWVRSGAGYRRIWVHRSPPASGAIAAPGMMESHYARAQLCSCPTRRALPISRSAPAPPGGLTLSASGDLTKAAANLYAHLRALDATGADTISVAPIPGSGLAEAIRDRLARAAAPR
jgi:L-threonylcarbamoyladenylate synthase